MPGEGKRDRLARAIANGCLWLSRRSVRFRLLCDDVGSRLFLSAGMGLDQLPLHAVTPHYDPADLNRRTDDLNVAAEDYFVRSDREYLLGKPFTDRMFFARRLFDLGVLFHWLRIAPGDTVLEMGAGSCWLSHLLNRYGCKTISVDVSETALGIGRELFDSDQHTNWTVEPEFVLYDGHRLPLEDGSVDKIIVYDAFHHIPNYEAVLAEMARVLREGGIIGMREPGRHHAGAEKSLAEVREFGVLENNIVVEEIEKLGRRYGLDRTTIVPLTIDESVEVPASELGDFMQGKNLRHFWEPLCAALVYTSFILMYKGDSVPDTRRPGRLTARITPRPATDPVSMMVGQAGRVAVEIENTGDTLWLAGIPRQAGWTRLGIRLHAAHDAALLDGDWHRAALPGDVGPNGVVTIEVDLPAIATAGEYVMRFDMVAEEVAWFADVDSPTAAVNLLVTPVE